MRNGLISIFCKIDKGTNDMRITYGSYKHIIFPVLPLTSAVVYNPIVHEEFKKMTEIDDLQLSLNKICKRLGVSQYNVYKWIEKHDMPVHRMY
jgi:hypothetical protein